MQKIKLAVLYGGKSTEHEVSIHSAETVGALMSPEVYEVYPVYITRGGAWLLQEKCGLSDPRGAELFPVFHGGHQFTTAAGKKIALDAAFPLVHGTLGEDGTLQGLLEQLDLAFVGCGVTASAIGMDKEIAKRLAALEGLPVLEHSALEKGEKYDAGSLKAKIAEFGYPVFVKPVTLGSSVGVKRVDAPEKLVEAIDYAFKFDTRVMIEKGVDHAREIVCGVLGAGGGTRASVCGEVRPKHEFYDYNAKYIDPDGMSFVVPAGIKPGVAEAMRAGSVSLFRAMRGSGLARVDFLLDHAGDNFYFCEINTIPGFTSHSLYPRLWQATGLEPSKVVDELVRLALAAKKARRELLLKPEHAVC